MQIDVTALLDEGAGGSRSRHLPVEAITLTIAGETVQVEPRSQLHVRLAHTGEGILVQAEMAANMALRCSRCLKPHETPAEVVFEELHLTRRTPADEAELREVALSGGEVDLTEGLRQAMVMIVPLRHVCAEDCRGLCPHCGIDLNEGACTCRQERVDPRLAKLEELKQRLAEEEE